MTTTAIALAFMAPGGWLFLAALGFLAFSGAVFLAPLTAWMQDRYPAEKRGELQSAANLQDCIAGMLAVVVIGIFEYATKVFKIPEAMDFRLEITFIGITCGLVTLSILRLLPGDFIRLVGGAIMRSIYRIQVVNPERIPPQGGALLLPNHVTFADGLFISAACPRPVRFVMDEAFMAQRSIRLFVSIFDTVTIRKDQPREAIRSTIDALKKGDLVCLFPEGQLTRTGTLNELRRGFELIAKKAAHPLIPMWCDGSWGSIFSFERGRFFRKHPYRSPYGITIAFDNEILSADADLERVRQGLLRASGTAVGNRFQTPSWRRRIPKGQNEVVRIFRDLSESNRQRIWVNGYQIGQVNALQRHHWFMGLSGDVTLAQIPSVTLTFPELFQSKLKVRGAVDGNHAASWVGGDQLRTELGHTQLSAELIFYDFGKRALEPIYRASLLHCPCLAIHGIVIAMSMPDPSNPTPESEKQRGRKLGTWGKLLPGWYLIPSETGGLIAHGPAAPPSGLPLPPKCHLDSEGFLASGK
jgi:acyl-[acyl-carrier-protein]-phospholipid O-acyltransferase/long-chain-fatty-acid--[acyl-carrier-protein] ligase